MDEAMQALMVLFNPHSPERADPYPHYAKIREAAPVMRTPFGMLVTRYEQVNKVLRSAAFRTPRGVREADDPAGPPRFDPAGMLSRHRRHWLLFQSGDAHTRLRKLLNKAFTPRAIRALVPRIEGLVDSLLGPIVERGSMEVIADLAYPLPATVICELLGIPEADRDRNRAWAADLAAILDPVCSDEQVHAAERAIEGWDVYIRELLSERRRQPGDALIDALLAVEDEGEQFSEDEIAANVTFLFTAGHETTTNLIGNGLLALLRNPDQLAVLRAEPGLLEGAIEELLRYDTPVQVTRRVALERTLLEGQVLEPEIVVSLAIGMANHDPRRYDRADQLDVRRRDIELLSFGGGAHYCIGAALARIEALHAFARLIPLRLELATEHPAWRPQLSLRALCELSVTVSPG